MKVTAKKHLFKNLFQDPCPTREICKQDDALCSGDPTLEGRRKEGCLYCSDWIPNAERWSKSEYPKC